MNSKPLDLSGNLIVQLGVVTEPLNRHWFERNTGQTLKDIQRRIRHPVIRWMGATLDGIVEGTGAVFEAKFILPWSFSSPRSPAYFVGDDPAIRTTCASPRPGRLAAR